VHIETIAQRNAPRRQTVSELVEDALAQENADLRDQVASLTAYRDLAVVALETVARLTKRNRELAERIHDVTRQLREMVAGRRVGERAA
jgi:hypothetical protein